MLNFDKNDMMRMAELGVLLVMAALVVFFVVRPLLTTASSGGGGFVPMLSGASSGGSSGGGSVTLTPEPQMNVIKAGPPMADSRIDIARIEGQVAASSVKQVSEFVEHHPEESVSILRAWLHESA